MKGIVFSLSRRTTPLQVKRKLFDRLYMTPKEFFFRYGLQTFFLLTFFVGMSLGAVYADSADELLLKRLDFLFLSNLSSRLEQSAFSTFCSCFTSNFIFAFIVFILGFCVWGEVALPFVSALKGFSVGLCSAYMFSAYKAGGIGFFILVILPGTLLFLLALITLCKESFLLSLSYARLTITKSEKPTNIGKQVSTYLFRSFVVLVFSFASSGLDMLLWVLFARLFNFT